MDTITHVLAELSHTGAGASALTPVLTVKADGNTHVLAVPAGKRAKLQMVADEARGGTVCLKGAGLGLVMNEAYGGGDAVRFGGRGGAMRWGHGDGNALCGGLQGDFGFASRAGGGNGDAIIAGALKGDAYRSGTGDGHAIRRGAGDGSAMNESHGKGDAIHEGKGLGDALRIGDGAGNANYTGSRGGAALRAGDGKGSASPESTFGSKRSKQAPVNLDALPGVLGGEERGEVHVLLEDRLAPPDRLYSADWLEYEGNLYKVYRRFIYGPREQVLRAVLVGKDGFNGQ